MATYNPAAAKTMLTSNGFTYKGSKLIDPKGNPVKLDIHVISGWSDWVASNQIITKNLQRHRHRLEGRARARLGLLVSERVHREDPDAALAERLAGLAVRLLLREPLEERLHPHPGQDGTRDRQLGALLRRERPRPSGPVEGDARPRRSSRRSQRSSRSSGCRTCRSSRSSSGRGGRRTAPSTSTASTTPEELLGRSDLHDVPGQHPLLHAHLPGRAGRGIAVG